MQLKYCFLAMCLTMGLLLAGCQATANSASTSAVASVGEASRPLVITETYTSMDKVAEIETLENCLKNFDYKDLKAENLQDVWKKLSARAEVIGYPTGMLEYTEYAIYQGYVEMARYYGKDLDTMLKEDMNCTRDEMITEIQREAKLYMDAELVARYILEQENAVTAQSVEKAVMDQYGVAVGELGGAAEAVTALNLSGEQVFAIANEWIANNLVGK